MNTRVLYCDETRTDGSGPFYLGALGCSPRRADILDKKLREVRKRFRCDGEMKWTKVSRKMLPVYAAFVDEFLKDPYPRLYVMRVETTQAWHAWGKSQEERFFKTYYAFFRRIMSGCCRHEVHLDALQAKPWRWNALKYALRGAARRDDYRAGRKLVPMLRPVDSKTSNVLQLVDVLLGALTAAPSSPHKQSLQAVVRSVDRAYEWTFSRQADQSSQT